MFDANLRGHLSIRNRLLERLEKGRLAGSLLFTGPEGVGKRRVALELAQRELCFRRNACGECAGCAPFKSEELPVELPNLLRIAPEGKAGLIKIGVIREDDLVEGGVIQWASHAPPPRCHRWILVEDAHRLGGAAANMLLKTLEEPPDYTHFLLITHRPESVLPTIRSRCERIPFGALSDEDVWTIAQSRGWEAKDRRVWTALSGGTLRYLDRSVFEKAQEQLKSWMGIARGEAFAEASAALLPEKGSDTAQSVQMAQSLELLLLLLGDVARIREGQALRLEPWKAELEALARSPLSLKPIQEVVYRALQHLIRNPSAEALLREVSLALSTMAVA